MLFYARQYIFKLPQWLRLLPVLTSYDAVVVDLVFLLLPLFCAVKCASVYIQDPQWLRLLSVLTGNDAVVVD